jgi:regulator of RNase E activity RraB
MTRKAAALGRVKLYPSAFGVMTPEEYERAVKEDLLPCADILQGQVFQDRHSGQQYSTVTDFVEACTIEYYRRKDGSDDDIDDEDAPSDHTADAEENDEQEEEQRSASSSSNQALPRPEVSSN